MLTPVYLGWRRSSIDVDLFSDQQRVFRDIQEVKERLNMNIEFARPEDFVPPLKGSADRHVFIDKMGSITFFHYDPYAHLLSRWSAVSRETSTTRASSCAAAW